MKNPNLISYLLLMSAQKDKNSLSVSHDPESEKDHNTNLRRNVLQNNGRNASTLYLKQIVRSRDTLRKYLSHFFSCKWTDFGIYAFASAVREIPAQNEWETEAKCKMTIVFLALSFWEAGWASLVGRGMLWCQGRIFPNAHMSCIYD